MRAIFLISNNQRTYISERINTEHKEQLWANANSKTLPFKSWMKTKKRKKSLYSLVLTWFILTLTRWNRSLSVLLRYLFSCIFIHNCIRIYMYVYTCTCECARSIEKEKKRMLVMPTIRLDHWHQHFYNDEWLISIRLTNDYVI